MQLLPLQMTRPIIVLFGDSITQQGFGWEGGTGWVSLLSSTYSRRADVINRGYSGYNTRHGVNLLPQIFGTTTTMTPSQDPLGSLGNGKEDDNENCNTNDPYYKDVLFVTIFFGANDAALPGELQHVPIEEYGENLSTMISYIRNNSRSSSRENEVTTSKHDENERGEVDTVCLSDGANDNSSASKEEELIPIILMTPPPVDVDVWYKERGGEPKNKDRKNDRANDTARRYGQHVKEIASTHRGCSVVDVFDLLGGNGPVSNHTKHLRDGLHLSSSGNQLVYDGLMNLIQLEYPHLLPMTDGNGRYGTSGIPLEEKLWRELC